MHYNIGFRLAKDKHSSLSRLLVVDDEERFDKSLTWSQYYKTFFPFVPDDEAK